MVKVKGTTIYGRLRWVNTYHSADAVTQVLDQLADREAAALLKRGPMRSSWYPFELFVDLIACIDRVCGKGDGGLYRQLAGQVAEDDLKSIYKAFFRVASTGFIIGKAAQVWSQYYDSGKLNVLVREKNNVKLEISNFETPHQIHCESVAGWIHRTVELTGMEAVSVIHSECRAGGDDRCLFDATWSG